MRYLVSTTLTLVVVGSLHGEAVRYYEENGATIREARSTVQVPVNDLRYQEQSQTYYRPYTTTQMTQVAVPTPVTATQYRWVPRWHGWWNVFRGPHLAYHLESERKRVTTLHTATVPVTRTAMVPETRTARVPVPYVRYEPREQVTRTVMLPSSNNTQLAQLPSPTTDPRLAATNFATHPRYTPYGPVSTFVAAAPQAGYQRAPTSVANAPSSTYQTYVPSYASVFGSGDNTTTAPQSSTVTAPRYVATPQSAAVYGGVARLDGDLPRYSTNNPYGVWQARAKPDGRMQR